MASGSGRPVRGPHPRDISSQTRTPAGRGAAVTGDKLDAIIRFGGDRKRPPVDVPLGQFLAGWARHDAIHVADMLKALPERRNDPEIVAWLARPDVATSISSYQKAMG
jgi:hypothetical protein